MTTPQNVFGSSEQQATLRRGLACFDANKNDERYCYYGRVVGVFSPQDAPLSAVADLARKQGNSNYAKVPANQVPDLMYEIKKLGLIPKQYIRWESGPQTLEIAKQILVTTELPHGISAQWMRTQTPQDIRASFAETTLSCGVLPPNLTVLSGATKPGRALMAIDSTGRVVSCAAASSYLHPDHHLGKTQCWWGMLSTLPDWRGRHLALVLGAHVAVEMHRRYGFTQLFTGVEQGNTASETLCRHMGLAPTGNRVVAMTDPALLPSGHFTK